jgi:adenine phosphoribosyltransferase
MYRQGDFAALIRDIPDFPKPGIVFKDITPLLQHPDAYRDVIEAFAERFPPSDVDVIATVDARGFLFGGALAYRLRRALVPLRKPGKLPFRTVEQEYTLEYGTGTLAIHEDAVAKDSRVLIVDDVIATGGTLAAAAQLVGKLGGHVIGIAALIELTFLNPRARLGDLPVVSLIQY